MLRLMVMRGAAGVVLVLALAGCGSDPAATASSSVTAGGSPDALCEIAAEQRGGTVASAFPTKVREVRAYMDDPHGVAVDTAAPRPGAYAYPTGWDGLGDEAPAAVCYLDGPVAKGPPPASDGTV